MLALFLLVLVLAALYKVGTQLHEGIERIEMRLSSIEDKLIEIKRQQNPPENRG